MPELPEVEILARRLDERLRGRTVARAELGSISALKTFNPPLKDLVGRTMQGCRRRGKYLCFDVPPDWLVLHLARGGWVKWRDKLPPAPLKPGKGPLALRVGLEGGGGFDVTEMGTEKRLAIWVVPDPSVVEGVRTLGPEPLEPSFTVDRLAELLAGERGDVKHAIAHQSLIAGVGNAYSDEALNVAKLSPFKPAAKLNRGEVERLHAALVGVISEAIDRSSELDLDELKDGKRAGMRVHGRTGQPCPECGDTVREVSFATRSLQYCPTCQTGGKPLADRRLSRLLK